MKDSPTQRPPAVENQADSDEFVRLLLASTGEGIYGIDLNGNCTLANPACLRLLGFESDAEVLGRNMHELVHHTRANGDSYPVEECRIYRAFQEHEETHVDDEVMWHADGSSFPAEYWSYPVERDGELVGCVVTFVDISERRRAEEELRQSNELVQLLLASTGEGIYGVDVDGLCTFANPACLRLLGYDSDDELLGRDIYELVHHRVADQSATSSAVENAVLVASREGREIHHDDEHLQRRDGSIFPAEYWSRPMSQDGEFVGSVVTFIDITDRRVAEDELRRATAAAEQASEAKSQFMANMSHELRTPMNAILGYSDMLIEDAEDDGRDEIISDLKKINTAGKHLLDLINAVLDLSKIEANRMDLHLEPVDLSELLESVVAVAEPLISKNGNELIKAWDDDLGVINTDTTKVRQSLFNLLSNAAKFTKHGTITLAVERTRVEGEDRVRFSVIDTGIGIPQDQLEHVFEEFAQADTSTARDYGGTGLGLSLTRRLCRLMGGDVWLESVAGEGSTFTIELPADASEAAERPEEVTVDDPDVVGRPRVLVIDDDRDALELITRGLSTEGYAVITAQDGERGLDLARELQPSLITLDIMMPGTDGWSVLGSLKADPQTSSIPVVMLSIAADREMGYVLGAVESLTKPIDRAELREVVERYVTQPGARVLVVEDDPDSRALLVRHLEDAEMIAVEAENGVAALDRVAEHAPDLVLLDLMMPEMDGFEFLEELRRNPEYRSIPVVVVTAKNLTAEDRARLNGEVERVIEKSSSTSSEVLQHLRDLHLPRRFGSPAP